MGVGMYVCTMHSMEIWEKITELIAMKTILEDKNAYSLMYKLCNILFAKVLESLDN